MKDSINVERHFRGMGPGSMNDGMHEHWRRFQDGMGGMHHFHHGHFPVIIFMAELLLITIVVCFTVWKMNKDRLRAEKEARG